MNTTENLSLPAGFDPASRVWIYQGHRAFSADEAAEARQLLASFTDGWNSHGHPVKGFADIYYNQFVVLLADETQAGVSGCSTDSSVQVIRQIQQQSGVRLFDRLNLAFLLDGHVRLVALAKLTAALQSGAVTGGSLYFNNTVQ